MINHPNRSKLQRGENWRPRGKVKFAPVPFKLLRVTSRGVDEYVFAGDFTSGCVYGDYAGKPFDPWRKGDLVVVCQRHTAHHLKGPAQHYETWNVARRDSTPAQVRHAYQLGSDKSPRRVFSYNNLTIWRIAYHYLQAASLLIGQEFETREALETAMEVFCPAQQAAE